LKIIFSLLQETIFPHFEQLIKLFVSIALSNDFLSPKLIGDLNVDLQFGQMTNVSVMYSPFSLIGLFLFRKTFRFFLACYKY